MRFLIDHSALARLRLFLEQQGHDVTRIGTDYPHDLPDMDVLAVALREARILITNDRDFGELIFAQRQPHAGVIYFRLSTNRLTAYVARMTDVLTNHVHELDAFLVVTDRTIRVRR
jgi:predicted nuclease of predicted toxin-antitoxin system